MITFNPENKKELTYRESLGPAMEITDQNEATNYFNDMVDWMVSQNGDREKSISIAKQNLGYYAGYYSNEVRERVERLFKCSHPIFGNICNGSPTAEEALQAGIKAANQRL